MTTLPRVGKWRQPKFKTAIIEWLRSIDWCPSLIEAEEFADSLNTAASRETEAELELIGKERDRYKRDRDEAGRLIRESKRFAEWMFRRAILTIEEDQEGSSRSLVKKLDDFLARIEQSLDEKTIT